MTDLVAERLEQLRAMNDKLGEIEFIGLHRETYGAVICPKRVAARAPEDVRAHILAVHRHGLIEGGDYNGRPLSPLEIITIEEGLPK